MNSKKTETTAKGPSLTTSIIVVLAAALAGFVAVYVNYAAPGNGGQESAVKPQSSAPSQAPAGRKNAEGLAAFAKGKMTTFVAADEPKPLPQFTVKNAAGDDVTPEDWKGKVVLLNLWATWCAPCREEMPSLDRLQAELGGDDFEVVAVSIDKSDPAKPQKFLTSINTERLAFYHDPTAKLGTTLTAYGMPTTLLIDREGREIGRLVGPAEWDSEEAKALIKAAIGEAGKGAAQG